VQDIRLVDRDVVEVRPDLTDGPGGVERVA
jgi:hypothetical protein